MLRFWESPYRMIFAALFAIFWISETIIGRRMRAGNQDRTEDRGSLAVLSVGFFAAWVGAIVCYRLFPQASIDGAAALFSGITVMVIGQSLRWWSVATLGRFFTVNVAIRTEHRLIESGPYRYVR